MVQHHRKVVTQEKTTESFSTAPNIMNVKGRYLLKIVFISGISLTPELMSGGVFWIALSNFLTGIALHWILEDFLLALNLKSSWSSFCPLVLLFMCIIASNPNPDCYFKVPYLSCKICHIKNKNMKVLFEVLISGASSTGYPKSSATFRSVISPVKYAESKHIQT